jgi:hypothetical protein
MTPLSRLLAARPSEYFEVKGQAALNQLTSACGPIRGGSVMGAAPFSRPADAHHAVPLTENLVLMCPEKCDVSCVEGGDR